MGLDLFVTPQQEQTDDTLYDVIVVGAGPAGATAAIYAARADLRTLVLDRGLQTGALGMATKIANYPGVPGVVNGAELLDHMRAQAREFGARLVQDKALSSDLHGEVKEIHGSQGVYRGRAVIIATGSMGRTQTVPGEERLVGRGVSYCATCDAAFFRDRDVAVVGNNDEAVEEALFLARFARRVYVLAPTGELRVSPELGDELAAHPKVDVRMETRLREIVGEQRVEAVRVVRSGGEEETIPVSGVFVYLQGGRPITGFVDLPKTETGCLIADETMQTNVPGVFAVGDVLCNHIKQAVIAAADGAIAAMAVRRYLSGRERLRPDWS